MTHCDPEPSSAALPANSPDHPFLAPRGRKKGKTGPQATSRLAELLPTLALPQATNRSGLLEQWGADPATARLVLEIGFGNGHTLATLAARHPQDRFIGVEVFLGGVAGLLLRIQQESLTNIRISTQDVQVVLQEAIPPASLDQVLIHFPDPWPKRSHHKRRLVQPAFLDLLATRLRPKGQLRLATDWPHYAQWMLAVLEAHTAFARPGEPGSFDPEPTDWVTTRFQCKAQEAGRAVFHLAYTRMDAVFGGIIPPDPPCQ
ncbi:MAG: tRNA (guanosine(46)-N7)-methyltransferase TrmB [Magnetococcales bacterium]|nr:tRNA (guanosine(46)-N7)-methyltransferase TrmB [Magnetococcales bacterium]